MNISRINTKYLKINIQRGITLVALIITIIVLLILATVSISLVINNGILDKAQHGVDKYSEEEELEQIKLAVASAMLKGNGVLTKENLDSELQDKFGEDKEAIENSNGWKILLSKKYRIYDDGKVEENKSILPSDYQQVEYLESTGTQYIDTRFKPTNSTDFEVISKALVDGCENGSSQSWQNNSLILVSFASNNGVRAIYNNQNYFDYGMDKQLGIKFTKLKLTHDGLFYVNDELVKEFNSSTIANNYSIKLFLASYGSELGGKSGQISNARIWDENLLVRNLIPCYRISDNKPGMYDLIEGNFYTNQNTNGYDFNIGPEV